MEKLLRKALILVLCIVMAFCMSLPAYADTGNGADEEEEVDPIEAMLSLDSVVPDELTDPDSKLPNEVYGVDDDIIEDGETNTNTPFLLSEQNELALIMRDNKQTSFYRFDNFYMGNTKLETSGVAWVDGINVSNAGSYDQLPSTKTEIYNDMRSIQSVGLDRDGTGRKQFMASVGIFTNYILLVIQNASTGDIKTINVGDAAGVSEAAEWLSDNYLAITAGDYDGDGKDSVVIYYPGDGEKPRIIEYYFDSSSSKWESRQVIQLSAILKERTFLTDSNYRFKPVVSLVTGDFNGDDQDQLAFSAGFYNTSGSVKDGYQNTSADSLDKFSTCVSVCDYTSDGWVSSEPIWMNDIADKYSEENGERKYGVTIMHAGVLAAGDVDNNGIDEIVAAGYSSHDEAKAIFTRGTDGEWRLSKVHNICNWAEKNALVSSVIYLDEDEYVRTDLERFEMSKAQKYTHDKYCKEEDWAFAKLAMACGKTNGSNSPEDVFISGIVYNYKDYSPQVKFTPNALGESDLSKVTGKTDYSSSVNWIRAVAPGNYDGNEAGREQFVFTLWQKASKKEYYSCNVGVISGVLFNDLNSKGKRIEYRAKDVVSFGPPEYYACNLNAGDITKGNYPLKEYGENKKGYTQALAGASTSGNIFVVPVAVDTDDDGILGRFRKNGYVYTDPQVLAVLEAGPYYGEIDEAGGYADPCGTTYNVETGFGTAVSRSDNVSFEAGFAGEVAAGCGKMSLELGYSMDWSHSYETSYNVSSGYGIGAQEHDLVILSRVPHLVYTYDVWEPKTKEWIENGYSVRVPLSPHYCTLGIDAYNEFVDKFNDMLGSNYEYRLKKISMGSDLPKDHEGNPDKYWSNWSKAGSSGKQLSKESYVLGTDGGYIQSTYSTETAKTEGTEVSHGFHYGLTLQFGGEYGVGEAWAGGYVNLDYSQSTGHSTTKTNTTAVAGQIQNISADAVNGLTVKQVQSGYGFTWTYGKWTRVLTEQGDVVPFYGYVVTNVKRRALPPELGEITKNLAMGYSAVSDTDTLSRLGSVLTIEKISGDSKITCDSKAKTMKIASGLEPGRYEAEFKISNGLESAKPNTEFSYDTTFTYIVNVKGSAPKIEGPNEMSIDEGYDGDHYSDPFIITGNPTPEMKLETFTDKISYDPDEQKIKVTPGLSEGEYKVILRAVNSLGESCVKEFTVRVKCSYEKRDAMEVSRKIRDLDVSNVSLKTGVFDEVYGSIEDARESYEYLSDEQKAYLGQAEVLKLEKANAIYEWIRNNDASLHAADNFVSDNQWQIDELKYKMEECYNKIRSGNQEYINEFVNGGYDELFGSLKERYESLMNMDVKARMFLISNYDGNTFFDDLLHCDLLLQKAYFQASGLGDPESEEDLMNMREILHIEYEYVEGEINSFIEAAGSVQAEDDFEAIGEHDKHARNEYLNNDFSKAGRALLPNLTAFTEAEKHIYSVLKTKCQNQLDEMLTGTEPLDNAISVTIMINELVGGTALNEGGGLFELEHARRSYEDLTDEEKEMVSPEAIAKLESLEELARAMEEQKTDIACAKVTAEDKTYTGKALKPTPEVVLDGTPLTQDVDYTVDYRNNTDAGTATVCINGIGFYKGNAEGSFTINAVKLASAKLSKTAVVYNGKAQKPTATVKAKVNGSTKTLKSGTDYTISYSNNKDVGKAKVTIKGKGNFTGSLTKTFKINPKGTTIKTPVAAKKAITVKWAAQKAKMSKTRITGYQIMLATNKAFTKGKKTVTVSGYSKTSKKITGLKAKTKYFIKVRTYKTVSGTKYYSKWSTVKTATAKA